MMRCGLLCLLLLIGALACQRGVVAVIDGHPVTTADYTRALQIAARNFDPILLTEPTHAQHLKEQVLRGLIDRQLLTQAAQQAAVSISPEELDTYLEAHKGNYTDEAFATMLTEKQLSIEAWRHELSHRLLAERYMEQVIAPTIEISAAAVRRYYDDHKSEFAEREAVHVRQILTDTEAAAKTIHAQILKGGNFAQLAGEYSISPEASEGGDLGWIERGQFPHVIESHCFPLATGAVSEIVKSEYGYHLFKVIGRRATRTLPFESVRAEIAARLQQDAAASAYRERLDQWRGQARIVIKTDRIAKIAMQTTKE